MTSFQHLEPPLRVHCGAQALRSVAGELERAGVRKAVVVCGTTLGRAGSGLQEVVQALGERHAGTWTGVRAHSPLPSVLEGARFLRESGADAVVAVGGGSAIVTARAASIVLAEGEDVHQLCTRKLPDGRFSSPRLLAPKLPQLVVPTTPTTACVKAGSAVFDPAGDQRLALFDPKTRAQAVFLHPGLASAAPQALVLGASLNGLAMACEGLQSPSAEPLADALLLQALRLYRDHLPALASADSQDVRLQLLLASVLAGKGTDYASGGLASVLGHAIGARCHVENGVAQAIVLPHAMRFNAASTRAGTARIGEVFLGRPDCAQEDVIAALSAFLRGVGVPAGLRDIGVAGAQLQPLAAAAMQDWFLSRNPRPVESQHDVLGVLQAAWPGEPI